MLRNIANVASGSDISTQAVIQYTVDVLGVTDIIVAGHYGCGGVAASLNTVDYGMLEFYLGRLRHISQQNSAELSNITNSTDKINRLVELNVHQQVLNVASSPFVQQAWARNQELRVHGMVYSLENGTLINLNNTKSSLADLPSALAIVSASNSSNSSNSSDSSDSSDTTVSTS